MIGLDEAADAVALLGELREALGDRIEAFELIGAPALQLVLQHIPDVRTPFEGDYRWYALLEAAVAPESGSMEQCLGRAAAAGRLRDAVIAKNNAEANDLWRMRHAISEAEKHEGVGLKHDISVPIGAMESFLAAGERRLAQAFPEARLIAFGHVGDGNLHYNVHLPGASSDEAARATHLIYELVTELGGSVSAEHGIGVLKKAALLAFKSEVELELMRALKATLDPSNILNPGKVI